MSDYVEISDLGEGAVGEIRVDVEGSGLVVDLAEIIGNWSLSEHDGELKLSKRECLQLEQALARNRRLLPG